MKELLLFISGAMVGNMIGIATMALAIASKEGGKMSYTNIGKCRSCGANIVWITMASGKKMPCDAGMISFDLAHPGDKEAQVYVTPEGKIARGYFDPAGDKFGYTSHFATCPNASSHRRKNK